MYFGKTQHINQIDFTLPPDHIATQKILRSKNGNNDLKAFVGCPVWANKAWLGQLYPKGIKEKDFLKFYTRKFNTIELNTTHYRIPDISTIIKWKQSSANGFKFCPKFPQEISHDKIYNKEATELTTLFFLALQGLEEHLGVSFLQLPPDFSPRQLPLLLFFLDHLPDDFQIAIELRHEGWFKASDVVEEAFKLFEDRGISTVITDVAGRRDVLHQRLTTTTALIRFVGNGLHSTDYNRIHDWVNRLKQWKEMGLENIYFFIHQPGNILDPILGAYMVEQINKELDVYISPITFQSAGIQGSLF